MLILGFCSGYSFWWNKEVAPFREMLLSAYHHSAHPKPVSFNLNREKKKKNLKGKSINGLFLYMWKNLLEGQFSLVDWWKNSSANYAALLNLKEYSEHWKPFSCLCGKTGKGSEAMSIRGAPRQLCASWDTGSGCAQRKLWAQAYGLLGKTHREVRGGKVEFPLRVLSTFLYLLSQ